MAFPYSSSIKYNLLVAIVRYLPFIPIGIFAFIFLYYGSTDTFPGWAEAPAYVTTVLLAVGIQYLIFKSNRWLDSSIPWKRFVGGRFVAGFVVNLLIVLGCSIAVALLFFVFSDTFSISLTEYFRNYSGELVKLVILSATIVLLYSVSYFTFYSFTSYSKGELDQLKLKRRQLELQLEILKSQLSPHYLFNSLNTISSLIYKDSDQAEEFIRRLVQSYNYILSTNERTSVELNKEVDFVMAYHFLLKVRFQNNINLSIELPEEIMSSMIPPLTLQLLVENAVKHNIISKDHPLSIQIKSDDEGGILVSNSKSSQNGSTNSLNIGLENIRKRYSYLTQNTIRITDQEYFTVNLPVVGGDLPR